MKVLADDLAADEAVLARIRAGDEAALATLYDRYAGLVYTLALRLCRHPSAAEEVLQDVFVTVWQSAALWDARRGSLQTWLCTIARNRSIDMLRKERSREALPLLVDMASDERGPDQLAEERVVAQDVRNALERLPNKYRDVLEAVYFSGLTQREAARTLGLPYGTVKSRIRLAIERLARALAARGFGR